MPLCSPTLSYLRARLTAARGSFLKPPINKAQGGLGAPDAPLPPHGALVLPQTLPSLQPGPPAATHKLFCLPAMLSLVSVQKGLRRPSQSPSPFL